LGAESRETYRERKQRKGSTADGDHEWTRKTSTADERR
jgi:hypothetical protein